MNEAVEERPDSRMVAVWTIRGTLAFLAFLVLPLLVSLAFALMGSPEAWVGILASLGALAGWAAVSYAWAVLNRRFFQWRLTDEEIVVSHGILFRRRATIPFMRVQNVNVSRGPLLMLFGLSYVEIETAGQRGGPYGRFSSEGYLPGVADGDALADRIVARMKARKVREGL